MPECTSRTCKEKCTQNHSKCARHAPCAASGLFDPNKCSECSTWLDQALIQPANEHSLLAVDKLRSQFIKASDLCFLRYDRTLYCASEKVAELFPDIAQVIPRRSKRSRSPVGKEADQSIVEDSAMDLFNKFKSWMESEAKRKRLNPIVGAEDRSIREELVSECSFATEPESMIVPARSQGWLPVPGHWQLFEQNGEWMALHIGDTDSKQLTQVKDVEITCHNSNQGKQFFWRTVRLDHAGTASGYAKTKSMAQALASLSTLVNPSCSLKVQLGDLKAPSVSISAQDEEEKDFPLTELEEWWTTKAYKEAAGLPSSKKSSQASAKFSVKWTEGSNKEKLTKFLAQPKVTKSDYPVELTSASTETLTAEHKTRTLALQAFQAQAALEMLSKFLKSALTSQQQEEAFDGALVLQLASEVSQGISSLLETHTHSLVEEAVVKRIELRKEAIPKKFLSLKQKILSSDPFHHLPFGNEVKVQKVLEELPKPLQCHLPSAVFTALTKGKEGFNQAKGKKEFAKGPKQNYYNKDNNFKKPKPELTEKKPNNYKGTNNQTFRVKSEDNKGKDYNKANTKQ